MFKIITERDEREEEALREEGREEARIEQTNHMMEQIAKREYVQVYDLIRVATLRIGDSLVAHEPMRAYYRYAKVTRIEDTYDDGRYVPDGHLWVSYDGAHKGSSLMKVDARILVEVVVV